MVLPLIPIAIAGGALAVSAIGQWLTSKSAQEATKAERDRVQALYNKLNVPNFDVSKLTPEDFQVVGKYAPQAAPYIAEAAPQLIKANSEGAVAGRKAQMDALRQYQQIAQSNSNPEMQAQINNANMQAGQQANTLAQNSLQDANRRGIQDSGLSFAAQLNGNAAASAQAGQLGQQAAVEAYKQRLAALQNASNLGGDIRQQDVNLEGQNAQYLNQFQQRQRAAQQDYQNQQAAVQNSAQMYNLGQAQQVANANTQQHNDYDKYNQQYNNQMAQQGFGDQLAIANGQAGQAQNNIAAINQNAQSTNAAIGGLGNAVTAGAMYYGQTDNAEQDRAQRQQQIDMQQNYLNKLAGPQTAPTGGYSVKQDPYGGVS